MAFRLPTQITIAPGCINQVAHEVTAFSSERVLLVVDRGLQATPWPQRIRGLLIKAGIEVLIDDTVEPNPRHSTVDTIAENARSERIELVVGLGGGSVLDTAKAVAMLLKNPGSCLAYEGKNRFKKGSAPFVAIPTTCGTGSEVTWVSVITNLDQQRKLSIKGDAMFPSVALVDSELLGTLPAHLIAYTGVDALTHAIEAYIANCANPISDALAEKAMHLLFNHLPRLFRDSTNAQAQFEVMRGSTLAGMAFGNADVGAVHCLSETIGGIWDVPHGLANAILLAPVMRYHEHIVRAKLAHLMALWGDRRPTSELSSQAFLEKIDVLVKNLEIPGFDSLAIPTTENKRIAQGATANNSNDSNPQVMGMEAYMQILNQLR